jgi:hypothetical protein
MTTNDVLWEKYLWECKDSYGRWFELQEISFDEWKKEYLEENNELSDEDMFNF